MGTTTRSSSRFQGLGKHMEMFNEETFFRNIARRLLDHYTIEEMLEIQEIDAVDWLAELIMTNQMPIDLIEEEFYGDDPED